jgi:hypothetical protein
MKLIIPKKLIADPKRMARVLTNGLNGVQKDIKIDFDVTTQGWDEEVEFTTSSPSTWTRRTATSNKIYGYVNDGTRPHRIVPKGGGVLRFNAPFRAKTVPGRIMSGPGSAGGAEVFSRGVNHPGSAPRNFDKTIKEKWDKQFATVMQRAIDSEV